MPARVTWSGLADEQRTIEGLPQACAGEARHLVTAAANYAAVLARTGYGAHRRSGNLQERVGVDERGGRDLLVRSIVRNRAHHAFIFEHGTAVRRTKLGANRGAGPKGDVFIPAMIRARQSMYQDLIAMIERHGARVHVS